LKKAKWFVCIPLVFALLFGTVAYAAGNMTDIEQKWLAFQRAVKDQQVKDGIMTQQDANLFLSKLESELGAGSEDVVYQKIIQGHKGKGHKFHEEAANIYAKLTNRSQEDVLKTCQAKNMTVWELAKTEGKLEDFKNAMLSCAKEKLSQLVKEGKMTQQEMDEKLQQMKSRLNRKE
jgi:regulator of sigma D